MEIDIINFFNLYYMHSKRITLFVLQNYYYVSYTITILSAKRGAESVLSGSIHPKRKKEYEKENLLSELEQTIVSGKRADAARVSKELLRQGMEPLDIINLALVKGMNTIGDRYARNQIFLPQVLQASEAMYEALDILLPLILKEAVREEGIITIGVVEGDVHDIGKNIVKTLLAAAGYEIIDLGRDVPADKFIDAVSARKAQVVAMSTLMTPTMDSMKNTVDALEQAGLRSSVLVIIGGAPTSQEFATEIGAELHATNAQEAVKKMKRATRSGTLI